MSHDHQPSLEPSSAGGLSSGSWWPRASSLSAYAIRTASLDAIPDISDPQIVVYVKWPRSPQLLETEVTEPLISALVGSPGYPVDPRHLAHGLLVHLRRS